jgi:hypothetical protein
MEENEKMVNEIFEKIIMKIQEERLQSSFRESMAMIENRSKFERKYGNIILPKWDAQIKDVKGREV